MKNQPRLFAGLVPAVTILIGLGASPSRAQPANDMFANGFVITGTNTMASGSNVGATKEPGEPDHAGNSGGASVWWTWTAPGSGSVTISTGGSSFDTLLAVYTGSSVSALTLVESNDDEDYSGGIYTSKVIFDVTAGQSYQIAVDGWGGDWGEVQLQLAVGPLPPPPPPPPPPPSAPAWALPDPYGQMVRSTNYAGKVVMLDFWATWCGPCKAEMPDLVALQARYGADGLVIVGADVSWSGESSQDVINFLATWTPAINYQIVMSTPANDQAYGGIDGIPTTFIIDRQNRIRGKYVGTQSRGTFETQLIPLLYDNARLACERNGNGFVLRWPNNALPFTLETAPAQVGTVWATWPAAPTVVNGTNTLQVPMTNSARYFRLRLRY